MKIEIALVLALVGVGCDYIDNGNLSKERADRTYRAAMDDYRAGHLEEAIAGLKKVCGADPANSSARFQLACLLQDSTREYFAAACAYREYLLQQPESDKAALAKERFKTCEREVARELADKYGLGTSEGTKKELADQASARTAAEEAKKKLESENGALKRRISALESELKRLKAVFRDADEDIPSRGDEALAEAKTVKQDDDRESTSSSAAEGIADAKALLEQEEEEVTAVLAQPPDAKERRDAARKAEQERREAEAQRQAEAANQIPDFYVVQKGETLSEIAARFYGTRAAWVRIQAANKAIISTDGRVDAGKRIRLPK